MRILNLNFLIGFLFILSPTFIQNLFGCSCLPSSSVYESFNNSKAVFTAKILSTEDKKNNDYTEKLYKVRILENFKGISEKEIIISAGVIESSCYFGGYTVGESYLIYAFQGNEYILNAENACSLITQLKDAQDQILFIRDLLDKKTESLVYGSVYINENDLTTSLLKQSALVGIEVQAISKRKVFKSITDKNGVYRFKNLPEDSYQLQIVAPKYKTYFSDENRFKVLRNKLICRNQYYPEYDDGEVECSNTSTLNKALYKKFTVRWNNETVVKLRDSEGKSIETNARMRLVTIPSANSEFEKYWDDEYERKNGEYSLFGKTPGKYLLVVELDAPSGKENKIRFFYPQVNSFEKGQIFDITDSSKLNLEFKLPEEIKVRKIIGQVLRENGGTVGGFVRVSLDSLEDVTRKENKQFAEMAINVRGRFEFNTLENEEYWAHIWIDDYEIINDEPQKVKKLIKSEKIKIGKESEERKIIVNIP